MKVGLIILFMGADGPNLYTHLSANAAEFSSNSSSMMDRSLAISPSFTDVQRNSFRKLNGFLSAGAKG